MRRLHERVAHAYRLDWPVVRAVLVHAAPATKRERCHTERIRRRAQEQAAWVAGAHWRLRGCSAPAACAGSLAPPASAASSSTGAAAGVAAAKVRMYSRFTGAWPGASVYAAGSPMACVLSPSRVQCAPSDPHVCGGASSGRRERPQFHRLRPAPGRHLSWMRSPVSPRVTTVSSSRDPGSRFANFI